MSTVILDIVGNPRPDSRTHGIARTLVSELARVAGDDVRTGEVDLARFGSRVLDHDDAEVSAAVELALDASIVVLASPTYKGTYSGLLKAFLDRMGTGAFNGAIGVPMLLGGAPNHLLAVDVHFSPLLIELGARVAAGGLFVQESQLPEFPKRAAAWVDANADVLLARERGAL